MNPTIAILGIIACAFFTLPFAQTSADAWVRMFAARPAKPTIIEHCLGKVVYIQFENAVVTKLKPDGKVWTCGGV